MAKVRALEAEMTNSDNESEDPGVQTKIEVVGV